MSELSFYPMITEELIDACGYSSEEYSFAFTYQNQEYTLTQSGKRVKKLSDPLLIWEIEDEGLMFEKKLKIAYPHLLYGELGIAPTGSELGICIIWTNRTLTQIGYISPAVDINTLTGRECVFRHVFLPGEIKGDLDLSVIFYLKKSAEIITDNETHLMNETGVILGEIEGLSLDFNSAYMEFPIEECHSKDQPLWWIEFSEWEDPRIDEFSKENICLYLNTAYDACPMVGESIKNIDLLIEIISTAYLLIFQKLSEDELLATKNNVGLNPNSICSIMHQFILDCKWSLQWESWPRLLRSIQLNVEDFLKDGE